ncbi:MAG: aldo/keto reductase [Leadbetterella sp.]|nr:aldo/keto reductase [Leadbetterella sp.]
MSRLGIGTVQFGKKYGINNSVGQVPETEVKRILKYSLESGLDFLDTATTYGNSEEVLGRFKNIKDFNIVTKLSSEVQFIKKEIQNSLINLNVETIYACLFHDFKSFVNNEDHYSELKKAKEIGLVKKIGFSVYFPDELEYLLKNKINFDIVQLPYNLFDRRFETLFGILKERDIEIHVRSVFLQGLFFMDTKKLSSYFNSVKPIINNLQTFCNINEIPIAEFLLNFILKNKSCDKIILGINSVKELKENLDIEKKDNPILRDFNFCPYKIENENILIPYFWK